MGCIAVLRRDAKLTAHGGTGERGLYGAGCIEPRVIERERERSRPGSGKPPPVVSSSCDEHLWCCSASLALLSGDFPSITTSWSSSSAGTRAQVTSGNALSKLVVGTRLWIPCRMGGRPLRAPPHDDDRHLDGRRSSGGIGLDLKPRHVLFFLLLQRAGLCMRRPAAQPSVIDAVV